MTDLIEKIILQLKILGITKIRLIPSDENACIAWESMGFKKVDKKGNIN